MPITVYGSDPLTYTPALAQATDFAVGRLLVARVYCTGAVDLQTFFKPPHPCEYHAHFQLCQALRFLPFFGCSYDAIGVDGFLVAFCYSVAP